MTISCKPWLTICGLLALLAGAVARADSNFLDPEARQLRDSLPVYQSPYYVLHTDVDHDDAREALIRMTVMFAEYHDRTKGFSGEIKQKLPFYLFNSSDEYYAGGGLAGSSGVFTGDALLVAVNGHHPDAGTWHIVQHEGFHQFAAAMIGGDMPIWLNEGMAEYFGEGIFTGDSFVTGGIPPARLRRLKYEINATGDKGLPTVAQMMLVSHSLWNAQISIRNYDKAWSMVHFLAHGEGGKFQKLFVNFMLELNRGTAWEPAWQHNFGDGNGFEEHWKAYWLGLDANPTDDVYARATVATLTSFLARAAAQRQSFMQFADFVSAAEAGQVKIADIDWLPLRLLKLAMADVASRRESSTGDFALDGPASGPNKIVLTLPDGTKLVGTFSLNRGRPTDIKVQTLAPPSEPAVPRHGN